MNEFVGSSLDATLAFSLIAIIVTGMIWYVVWRLRRDFSDDKKRIKGFEISPHRSGEPMISHPRSGVSIINTERPDRSPLYIAQSGNTDTSTALLVLAAAVALNNNSDHEINEKVINDESSSMQDNTSESESCSNNSPTTSGDSYSTGSDSSSDSSGDSSSSSGDSY
jgi:hypothetical protein